MSNWVIEAHDLQKTFAWTPVLNSIACCIRPGASVGIFGPNGAGKTTLLRLFATLLKPTAGTLTLFGVDPLDPAIRRKIGFLGHDSFLYPDLTPEENLTFYGKAYNLPNLADRIDKRLEQVGLEDWRAMPVRHFSRGMEQRLGLARALLHEPDLFLLDEPYTGLDTRAVAILDDTLTDAKAQGKTVVLSSHDFDQSRELLSQAIILNRGHIAWQSGDALPSAQEFIQIYRSCTHHTVPC